jgi:hypothetical protein
MKNKNKNKTIKQLNLLLFLLVLLLLFSFNFNNVLAVARGPNITQISNETASLSSGTLINTTGGSITTMVLNSTTQNLKWKAYVGNVTGSLVLDDASGYSIFDWSVTTNVAGEVYATRSSSIISWSDINCSNMTHIVNEENAINHTTNPDDNISATFSTKNHTSFYIGTTEITSNSCYSIHTNVNDQAQTSSFEEIILYDGTNTTNGDLVFTTKLEQDVVGYNSKTYDFQMIVPEIGLETWTSSTGYYFYVELT